jgi:hypothetical protein
MDMAALPPGVFSLDPGPILKEAPGLVKEAGEPFRLQAGWWYTGPAMELEKPDALEERILRRIPAEILAVSAVLALPAALIFDFETGLVFFAGGAFASLGFAWLKHSLTRFLARDRKGALRTGILLYALRLVLICGVFFLIILLYPRKILAFGAGFSMIVLVSLVEGVRALLLMRTWKD